MVIKPREIYAKNKRIVRIESASPVNAREILAHRKQVAEETYFLLGYPEEHLVTDEAVEKEMFYLKKLQSDPKCLMLSAMMDGKLVGLSSMLPAGSRKKVSHRGGMCVALLKEAWRLGIGQAMMEMMEEYAGAAGYTQLELSVLEDNKAACALYGKLGFQVYGTLPGAVRLKDGTYKTMVLMYKNLLKAGEAN